MIDGFMENDRYIRLDGYPVHEPLWKTFHLSAHAQAGGILSAVMAGANYNNPKQALIYLATGRQQLWHFILPSTPSINQSFGWHSGTLTKNYVSTPDRTEKHRRRNQTI